MSLMSMTHPIPVWLDCDPGHDDATAILLAGYTPGLQLLGVSTIGGNHTLAKVTHNALDVLDAIGLSHVGVVAGQPRPLMRPPLLCPEIHGDTGLDGPGGGRLLPRSPRAPLAGKAINVMYDAIKTAYEQLRRQLEEDQGPAQDQGQQQQQRPGDGTTSGAVSGSSSSSSSGGPRVRLVCTGALTNAALLLTVYPEAVQWLEVTLMGGALGVGNTGPVMEFNIQTDVSRQRLVAAKPEAAKIVFESGVPLTMVPLEVTHTVLATPQVLASIGGSTQPTAAATTSTTSSTTSTTAAAPSSCAAPGVAAGDGPGRYDPALAWASAPPAAYLAPPLAPVSRFRHTMQQMLLFFAATYREVFRFEHPPLHDPVAVAYVARPELFECRRLRVDVETLSSLSYGQTVCDIWGQSGRPANVNVALRVDVAGFWELLLAAVARADTVSPLNAPLAVAGAATPALPTKPQSQSQDQDPDQDPADPRSPMPGVDRNQEATQRLSSLTLTPGARQDAPPGANP